MTINIQIKQVNSEFDKKYSDEYHFGKESDTNQKYNDVNGFAVDKVKEVALESNSVFELGSVRLTNMEVLKITFEDGKSKSYGIASELVEKTHYVKPDGRRKKGYFYYYLKDREDIIELHPRLILVTINNIPAELRHEVGGK